MSLLDLSVNVSGHSLWYGCLQCANYTATLIFNAHQSLISYNNTCNQHKITAMTEIQAGTCHATCHPESPSTTGQKETKQ